MMRRGRVNGTEYGWTRGKGQRSGKEYQNRQHIAQSTRPLSDCDGMESVRTKSKKNRKSKDTEY